MGLCWSLSQQSQDNDRVTSYKWPAHRRSTLSDKQPFKLQRPALSGVSARTTASSSIIWWICNLFPCQVFFLQNWNILMSWLRCFFVLMLQFLLPLTATWEGELELGHVCPAEWMQLQISLSTVVCLTMCLSDVPSQKPQLTHRVPQSLPPLFLGAQSFPPPGRGSPGWL